VTAAVLLTDLASRGVHLVAVGERLRVDAPAGALTEADRLALAARKGELLALLAGAVAPIASAGMWDQAEADALVAESVRRLEASGWPADAAARRRLGLLADAVDNAFLGQDLPALRKAVAEFLKSSAAAVGAGR
jgi:hypothetical protein